MFATSPRIFHALLVLVLLLAGASAARDTNKLRGLTTEAHHPVEELSVITYPDANRSWDEATGQWVYHTKNIGAYMENGQVKIEMWKAEEPVGDR